MSADLLVLGFYLACILALLCVGLVLCALEHDEDES